MTDFVENEFGTKDVVKYFGLPEKFKEVSSWYLVVPLTEVLIARFVHELTGQEEKLGVTDKKTNQHSPRGTINICGYRCDYVIDGKLVFIATHTYRTDIDAIDEDESWFCAEKIFFGGDDQGAKKLYEYFLTFVAKQDFDELKEATKTELQKGKDYHLSFTMRKFYGI